MASRDLSQPIREVRYEVPPGDEGQRLDHWLSIRVSWRSRNDLQRRIRDGRILLDGRPARKSARLITGQTITVSVDEDPESDVAPLDQIPLRILHEDEWLVALDKTAGVVVHPVGRHVMDTLINALHAHYRQAGDERTRPMIVHRLDRDTSGVLVLAKSPEVRKQLGAAFEDRRVVKSYLALVAGRVGGEHGIIDAPIGPDLDAEIRLKVACVPGGKPSRTRFQVVGRRPAFTLLRCHPETGRQHQIRVHLAHLGHPILCDHLYGDPRPIRAGDLDPEASDPDRVILARQALHAEHLRFTHPVTQEPVDLRAPQPPDFAAVLGAGR